MSVDINKLNEIWKKMQGESISSEHSEKYKNEESELPSQVDRKTQWVIGQNNGCNASCRFPEPEDDAPPTPKI